MNRRLIYVVGPSGAGKDSVLSWLRAQTPESAPVHWARRTIDRPNMVQPGAEDHESVASVAFEQLVADAALAMHWDANTHRYGIRHAELDRLKDPAWCVMVNGSRAHLPLAARDFPGLTVLHITAAPDVLRERLTRRGRESPEAIEARLSRSVDLTVPNGSDQIEISNDSTLDVAGHALRQQLHAMGLWPPG
jgi:ribose 1,5-bisphosphokinase